MFTIKKIWDILNHSGKPWQISLAFSFAIIFAFQPSFTLISLIVLALVLVLNIHLTLFIFLFGFLKILAMFLDSVFDIVGNYLLSSSSLVFLFENIQNNSILSWVGFNNSIILGSFIISLFLALLQFPITNRFLVIYREKIATLIQNIPILNKINYFKKEEEKVSIFRVVGVIVLGIIFIIVFIFTDIVVKNLIEKEVSKTINKSIKIESLNLSLINSNIKIAGMEISDEKDKFFVEKVSFDFSLRKALLKKIYIEKLEVLNLKRVDIDRDIKSTTQEVKSKDNTKVEKNVDNFKLEKLEIDTKEFDKSLVSKYEEKIKEFKKYYKKIVPYIKNEKKTEEQFVVKRADGVWYFFKETSVLPDFVVENTRISYILNEEIVDIEMKDFSSDQDLYKKPILINIKFNSSKMGKIILNSTLTHNSIIDLDNINFVLTNYKRDLIYSEIISFENSIISSKGNIQIVDLESIKTDVKINFDSTTLILSEKIKVSKYLNSYLTDIKDLDFKINSENESIKIKSNLDRILSQASKTALKANENRIKEKAVKKIEEKLKNKIDVKEIKNFFKF